MPVGPFESWPAADRLSYLAVEMAQIANVAEYSAPAAYVVAAWGSEIQRIADELSVSSLTSAPVAALCAVKGRGRSVTPCDRPDGHRGDHSWEADRQRRLRREYEAEAVRVPDLTRRLTAMTALARKLGRERDALKPAIESTGWAAARSRRRSRRR